MSDLKPGDVAIVKCADLHDRIAILHSDGTSWMTADGKWSEEVAYDPRPLIVLDPRTSGPAAEIAALEAQVLGLLKMNTEKAAEIRRLRMGNHPAGRALRPVTSLEAGCTCGGMAACQQCQDRDAAALAEALTERDAEHETTEES